MLFFLLSTIGLSHADEYDLAHKWDYQKVQVTICSDAKVSRAQVEEAVSFWRNENHPGHKSISTEINVAAKNDSSCKKGWKYGHILIGGQRDINTYEVNGRCQYWHNRDNKNLVSAFIKIDDGLSSKKRGHILIHEFGHAIGLDHNNHDSENIMFHTN